MSSPTRAEVGIYAFASLRFDPADGRLWARAGRPEAHLRPQVARLLCAFLEQPQTLLDRDQLCRAVWDEGTVVDFESGLSAVLRELRAELKSLGAPADLIETVPRRGYRLGAEVRLVEATDRTRRPGRRRVVLGAAALVLLGVLGALGWQFTRAPQPAPGWTLAVLPFNQFGEPAHGPARLDLLMADLLLGQLWEQRPDEVSLIGRASLAPYSDSDQLARDVAEDLGVNLLIEGTIVFEDERMSVTARALEMPGGRILWSETVFRDGEQPPVPGEIAAELAASLSRAWAAHSYQQP
ncbi:MAG: hypothetical protein EA419_00560 [Wenzhouxiangella sp.]|nr:MAG: hypothetical protein EA419_00560 [Wenzhouxiangella sp.]